MKTPRQSLKRDLQTGKTDSQAVDERNEWQKHGFAGRLRSAIGMRKPAEVARAVGVAPQTLDGYLKGAMPSADRAFTLAQELGVNPLWLVIGNGPQRPTDGDSDWLVVPRYDLRSFEDDVSPEPIGTERIRRDWIARAVHSAKGLWVADLLSDAMPDLGREGDTILCRDVQPPLTDGWTYVLLLDGRVIIRLVQARADGVVLTAGSSAIDPITVEPDQFEVLIPLGRVVGRLNLQAV